MKITLEKADVMAEIEDLLDATIDESKLTADIMAKLVEVEHEVINMSIDCAIDHRADRYEEILGDLIDRRNEE